MDFSRKLDVLHEWINSESGQNLYEQMSKTLKMCTI